jgi:hypothetical protein
VGRHRYIVAFTAESWAASSSLGFQCTGICYFPCPPHFCYDKLLCISLMLKKFCIFSFHDQTCVTILQQSQFLWKPAKYYTRRTDRHVLRLQAVMMVTFMQVRNSIPVDAHRTFEHPRRSHSSHLFCTNFTWNNNALIVCIPFSK